MKRLKTGSVERDAGTKRLKHLELKFKLEVEGSLSMTISGFWDSKVKVDASNPVANFLGAQRSRLIFDERSSSTADYKM